MQVSIDIVYIDTWIAGIAAHVLQSFLSFLHCIATMFTHAYQHRLPKATLLQGICVTLLWLCTYIANLFQMHTEKKMRKKLTSLYFGVSVSVVFI